VGDVQKPDVVKRWYVCEVQTNGLWRRRQIRKGCSTGLLRGGRGAWQAHRAMQRMSRACVDAIERERERRKCVAKGSVSSKKGRWLKQIG